MINECVMDFLGFPVRESHLLDLALYPQHSTGTRFNGPLYIHGVQMGILVVSRDTHRFS